MLLYTQRRPWYNSMRKREFKVLKKRKSNDCQTNSVTQLSSHDRDFVLREKNGIACRTEKSCLCVTVRVS